MKKLEQILKELEQGKISADHAEAAILRLFDENKPDCFISTKELKIESITEAFSMQPVVKRVSMLRENDTMYDFEIKNIELEVVYTGDNPSIADVQMMYVGYNFKGEKKFKYLAKAVNVDFF